MKTDSFVLLQILFILNIFKKTQEYNSSVPFNWTQQLPFCYVEDFILNDLYRPFQKDIYPVKGCSSDERNYQYDSINLNNARIMNNFLLANVSFQPRLDYFFNKDEYPPYDRDPPTSIRFKIINSGGVFYGASVTKNIEEYIYFGRSEDYQPIPKISKRTGKPIEFNGNTAKLLARIKFVPTQFYQTTEYNYSYSDHDIYDYESKYYNVTFDGYFMNITGYGSLISGLKTSMARKKFTLLLEVFDVPRMKVQGLFQYKYVANYSKGTLQNTSIYTVDTRNIFFQNISMFYNQRVNVTNEGLEPTGEDSGFWVKTPCNTIQMATIMVDYHFFDTIHRMQSYGFEFSDRFQLRIHTPYYRKTLNSEYSLFRSQWNKTYPEPRVFIHPIYAYKNYCDTYKNCTKFDYDEWSTDPKFTKYIIDIKNEIRGNQIWINFTELEKIYEADGFHRGKLSININNTMTPHITQITNGLWAELYDTLTQDWVMKTKTSMDEVHGYIDDYEPDPYRNFYLTCEIPDNITANDVEFFIKKYGVLQTAHLWYRLDVFNLGITKLYPPRFNTVFKFPKDILVTNNTFMYTYQYYIVHNDINQHWYWVQKDLRETGIGDGTITNSTFDIPRNIINVSELHPNTPNGDDTWFWTHEYIYLCYMYYSENDTCTHIQVFRSFLYYFMDLEIQYNTNDTAPVDITVYHIKYVPYHSKDQINRGIHRWNPHHAGWTIPNKALNFDTRYKKNTYNFYYEAHTDNFYYKAPNSCCYYNFRGTPIGYTSYSGPDCVFGIAGGSTMRNTSCEFWAGIIPDKPFTNYARDIYEEHVAYRTINDKTFSLNTSQIVPGSRCNTYLFCMPGRPAPLILEIGYWYFRPPRGIEDGDPCCIDYFIVPKSCELYMKMKNYKPITNINKNPQDYFLRIDLPENLTVLDDAIGKLYPCFRPELNIQYFLWFSYSVHDQICYYFNSSTIYAFNSIQQIGTVNENKYYDVPIYIDALFYKENSPMLEKHSGLARWGFYDNPFFYVRFPEYEHLNSENVFLYPQYGQLNLSRDNFTNDALTTFNVSIKYVTHFYLNTVFKLDFGEDIKYLEFINQYVNDTELDYWEKFIGLHTDFFGLREKNGWDFIEKHLKIKRTFENTNFSFQSFFTVHYKENLGDDYIEMKKIKYLNFTIIFKMINSRSIKPIDFHLLTSSGYYDCLYELIDANFTNTEPQILQNLSVYPNSYFTNDRAIYTFDYITYTKEYLIGDVFEFKTSWKTKFKDNEEDPNDKGYYINRIYFDKNMTNITHMLLKAIYLLNPETLETQYIKGIHMYDKDGYLISIYNETIPIKMKKVTGFKRSEVQTEKTEIDNKFDIRIEAVPEVLITKNDTLNLKFSSIVALEDYPNLQIESSKGLNIESPDFDYKIDIDNNELILYNAFKDIGENETIFENLNSTALTDQQFIFTLKNIPMYSNGNDLENVFSIELKTEREGRVTQKNLLPSTAIFKCDSRCKTCNEETPSECMLCSDKYPYYFPNEKYCHSFCPKEKYYEKENENGNIECLFCEEPCENCYGNATNCTFCSEGYFMENNICVKDCGEGNDKDYILRKCFPIVERNKTFYIDRTLYVNVSVPDYYPVYIERNVCMIGPY